jgi:hypothetical protein
MCCTLFSESGPRSCACAGVERAHHETPARFSLLSSLCSTSDTARLQPFIILALRSQDCSLLFLSHTQTPASSSNGSTSQKERAEVMRLSNRKSPYSPSPLVLCIYYEFANEDLEEKSSRAGAGAPAPATQGSPNQSEIRWADQATQGMVLGSLIFLNLSQSFSMVLGKGFTSL